MNIKYSKDKNIYFYFLFNNYIFSLLSFFDDCSCYHQFTTPSLSLSLSLHYHLHHYYAIIIETTIIIITTLIVPRFMLLQPPPQLGITTSPFHIQFIIVWNFIYFVTKLLISVSMIIVVCCIYFICMFMTTDSLYWDRL